MCVYRGAIRHTFRAIGFANTRVKAEGVSKRRVLRSNSGVGEARICLWQKAPRGNFPRQQKSPQDEGGLSCYPRLAIASFVGS